MGVFERLLRKYEGHLERYGKADYWKRTLDLLEEQPNAVLLDCGCCEGQTTLDVAKRVNPSRIYGIDIVEDALKKARQRGITTINTDLNEEFPLSDDSIDVVFSNQVIEHLTNTLNFIREIHRVLRPGGYAVVGTENLASWVNIFALILGWQPFSSKLDVGNPLSFSGEKGVGPQLISQSAHWHGYGYGTHNKVLAYESLQEIFYVNNFRIERVVGSGYFPFPEFAGNLFSRIDPRHTFYLTVKARKPRKKQ